MLQFNDRGFLTPHSIISSTIKELEEFFVFESPNDVRRCLFDRYINYVDDLKKACGNSLLRQWIDGSFVTKKNNPADIDLVTFIDFENRK